MLDNLKIKRINIKEKTIDAIEIKTKFTETKYILKKDYIDLLNTYQSHFNFKLYKLLPNYYGKFLYLEELENYNDIPDDILEQINISFQEDIRKKTIMKGLHIESIQKKSMVDIGTLLGILFNSKKKEKNFNYNNYYNLSKCIIKYIPKECNKDYQLRLYNLTKIFDKDIGEYKEILSYDILYSDVNKCIFQFINESIEKCGCIESLKMKYPGNIYELIEDNKDILFPDKYAIIPNQLGIFCKLVELYKDKDVCEELIEILNKYNGIKRKLIDNRIISFKPEDVLTNESLKKQINKIMKDFENEIKRYEKEAKYQFYGYRKDDIPDYKKLKKKCKYKYDLFIKELLELIPEENNEKQRDIYTIYEMFWFNKKHIKKEEEEEEKEKKEKIIQLDPSFWEQINEKALEKCLKYFEKKKNYLIYIQMKEKHCII